MNFSSLRLVGTCVVLFAAGTARADNSASVLDPDPYSQLPKQSGQAAAVNASAVASSQSAGPVSGGETQRALGLLIGGVGVAGLAFGTAAIFEARSAGNQAVGNCYGGPCNKAQIQSSVEWTTISDISLIAGGIALGAGAIVFFTSSPSTTRPGLALSAGAAPNGGALFVFGRF